MNRTRIVIPLVLLLAGAGLVVYLRRAPAPIHYTGFVEGEERVIRSEVAGRVVALKYAEGATIPPEEVVIVLDDRDIQARLVSKRREIDVLAADITEQQERIALVQTTWERELAAQQANVRQAQSAAENAARTFAREQELVTRGASTAQLLDDARARRDQAQSALEASRAMLARVEAQERNTTLARQQLETLRARHALLDAQLAELDVTLSKYVIRSPGAATVMQTQFVWPGELAQPGTALVALIDPRDKYVQIYVPVVDVGRLQLGQRVEIELDSRPGYRVPGEISFIADQANFTPEKIETRSDRVGQVYRAKVRILEDVESFQPGTEGNVYLSPTARVAAHAAVPTA